MARWAGATEVALKAEVCRLELEVSDVDRQYYAGHRLTVARHPSETDERMMHRIIAFALHAHADLELTRGLSTTGEPDLWRRDATGAVVLWVELGQPDGRRLRRACGRARRVAVHVYDEAAGRQWRARRAGEWARFANLSVALVRPLAGGRPEQLAARAMGLGVTIQDNRIWLSDAATTLELERRHWKDAGDG